MSDPVMFGLSIFVTWETVVAILTSLISFFEFLESPAEKARRAAEEHARRWARRQLVGSSLDMREN